MTQTPPIHSALLLAAGKSRVHIQLPSMVLIKGWCTSEKPWITLVLASSSLCGILGFAKSRTEKANKRCLSLDLCAHLMCLHPESAYLPKHWQLAFFLRPQSIHCCLEWRCSQPIRHLKSHEDLLPHFAVSIILLLVQKCYCVLWNPACLYPDQCVQWMPSIWGENEELGISKYIQTSVLGFHVCQ